MRFSFVPNLAAADPKFPVRCFAYRNLVVSVGRAKWTFWLVCDKNTPALAGWFAFLLNRGKFVHKTKNKIFYLAYRIQEVDQRLVVSPERFHGTAVALPAVVVSFEMTVYATMIRPHSVKGGGSSVPMAPDFLRLCYWELAVEVEAVTYPGPMANPSDVPPRFDCYRCVDYLVLAETKALVAVAAPK